MAHCLIDRGAGSGVGCVGGAGRTVPPAAVWQVWWGHPMSSSVRASMVVRTGRVVGRQKGAMVTCGRWCYRREVHCPPASRWGVGSVPAVFALDVWQEVQTNVQNGGGVV